VPEDFGQSEKKAFDYIEEFGWKEGVLVFKDADLKTFCTRMERCYDVHINVVGKNLEDWEINGRFKHEPLEDVLKSLAFSQNVSYKINDGEVTIYLGNRND